MSDFDYDIPAELYTSTGQGARSNKPVTYRRFATSAEAIRFAIEELPQLLQCGTAMEVEDERFEFREIRDLYGNERYPLSRPAGMLLD